MGLGLPGASNGSSSIGDVVASTAPITYSINGGGQIHGVQSSWIRQPIRINSDGSIVYNNWTANRWIVSVMDMANFEILRAQSGTTLTTLESNDFSSRNNSKTYNSVILESVVNGQQFGLIMQNISLNFMVDITS